MPLTVTEFTLLHALARHPGHVKTREQLLEEGYPHDTYVSDRTIDSHIKRLRQEVRGGGRRRSTASRPSTASATASGTD